MHDTLKSANLDLPLLQHGPTLPPAPAAAGRRLPLAVLEPRGLILAVERVSTPAVEQLLATRDVGLPDGEFDQAVRLQRTPAKVELGDAVAELFALTARQDRAVDIKTLPGWNGGSWHWP
jgi:hypothetical protein